MQRVQFLKRTSDITPRRPKIPRLLMAGSTMKIPIGVAWVLLLILELLPVLLVLKSGMMSSKAVMFSKKCLRKRK